MAFRKKAGFINIYQPDIVIVPECEHPDKLKFNNDCKIPSDIIWEGNNKNKGLGVFSYSNYKFKLLDDYNPELKNILPIDVQGGNFDFILFAIWANNPEDPGNHYVGQVWKAINYYENLLNNTNVILMGDFNSNSIWDYKHPGGSHSDVVNFLKKNKIQSTYHAYHQQLMGKETHPTLYMHRHLNKPYHIDYCFASEYFIDKLKNVEVGEFEKWIPLSDHMPLVVDFEINC